MARRRLLETIMILATSLDRIDLKRSRCAGPPLFDDRAGSAWRKPP